jgi:phospholipid N-methyltransferase
MSTSSISKGRGLFLKESLKGFKVHGSFFPSSKFLGERMLDNVEMKSGICIIELGAGTGAFTKQILNRLPADGKLIVFEINPSMVEFLKSNFIDPRLFILEADASDIVTAIQKIGIANVDYIISGLPLGNFRRIERDRILRSIVASLNENGTYLQFQYLLASYLHIKEHFVTKIVGYEYRNIPPAFIYHCKKKKA